MILSVPDYRQIAYRFGGNLVAQVIKKGKLVVDTILDQATITDARERLILAFDRWMVR